MSSPPPAVLSARPRRRKAAIQANFVAMLDAAPDAMVVVNSTGSILFANRQVESLFGHSATELLGRPVEMLLPERFRTVHLGHRASYNVAPRARPMGSGLEMFGRHRDGTEFPVEVSLGPVETAAGPIVIAAIRDISERKDIEAERARLLAAEQAARQEAESANRALRRLQAISDSALGHLALDDLMTELLRRLAEVLGADAAAILLLSADGERLVVQAVYGFEGLRAEGREIPKDGSITWRIAASREPIVVHELTPADIGIPALTHRGLASLVGAPLLVRDEVIGIVHVDAALPHRFSREDAELLFLAAQRIAMAIAHARLYGEAVQALRLREDVMSLITHDLGQPLTTVQGYAQWLHRRAERAPEPDAELIEGLEGIQNATTDMRAMLGELLDSTRLQAGQLLDLHREPTDLVALVQELAAAHQQTTRQHVIIVDASVPALVVDCDRVRITRVVANLLSNAIKFSPLGGPIIVRVAPLTGESGAWALLAVRDAGLGIPAADLPHVFERFYRAANVRGSIEGTGLGLAGAKQIIDQHGGRIAIASEEGTGTTITVHLALAGYEVPTAC